MYFCFGRPMHHCSGVDTGPNVSTDHAASDRRVSALGADDLLIALLRETASGGGAPFA
jgi:hypothetical protein